MDIYDKTDIPDIPKETQKNDHGDTNQAASRLTDAGQRTMQGDATHEGAEQASESVQATTPAENLSKAGVGAMQGQSDTQQISSVTQQPAFTETGKGKQVEGMADAKKEAVRPDAVLREGPKISKEQLAEIMKNGPGGLERR